MVRALGDDADEAQFLGPRVHCFGARTAPRRGHPRTRACLGNGPAGLEPAQMRRHRKRTGGAAGAPSAPLHAFVCRVCQARLEWLVPRSATLAPHVVPTLNPGSMEQGPLIVRLFVRTAVALAAAALAAIAHTPAASSLPKAEERSVMTMSMRLDRRVAAQQVKGIKM